MRSIGNTEPTPVIMIRSRSFNVLLHDAFGKFVFFKDPAQRFKSLVITLLRLHLNGFVEQISVLEQIDDELEQVEIKKRSCGGCFLRAGSITAVKEVAHRKFLIWRIIEDPEANLVAETAVLQEVLRRDAWQDLIETILASLSQWRWSGLEFQSGQCGPRSGSEA